MYDWNGNGKHDSLDDAIFHALLEDGDEYSPKVAVLMEKLKEHM